MSDESTSLAEGKVSEKLLDLVWNKCEITKKDLEKNWTYQIVSVGVSLGLIFGLGKPLSKHFLDEEGYDTVLYVVLPLVNLYLFMRFGSLASVFSEARLTLESLARAYFRENQFDQIDLNITLKPSVIFDTNSYFEYYHRTEINTGVFVYSLFVPLIFAASHAASLYLVTVLFTSRYVGIFADIVYLIPIVALYTAYYQGNKSMKFVLGKLEINFILVFTAAAAIFTTIFFILLIRYSGGQALFHLKA